MADFVTQGRQGTLTHSYDAVSGSVLSNPVAVRIGKENPKTMTKSHGANQLAIFSDKAAALFEKYRNRCC